MRTLHIYEDELIIGNVNSKIRGSLIFGYLLGNQLDAELDDPVYDYEIRSMTVIIFQMKKEKLFVRKLCHFLKGIVWKMICMRERMEM